MWRFYGKRFLANPLALVGAGVLAFLSLAAMVGPLVLKTNPNEQRLTERLRPPSLQHPLGTDDLGRDVAARMVHGARVSLRVGLVSVGLSVLIGTGVGLTAGFFGGWIDGLLMRAVDIMLCFPTLFLILMVIAFLDPSLWTVMTVIGLTSWPGLARLVRGETLSLRERDFVFAARGLGLSVPRLVVVHLLPNLVVPILVSATLGVGSAILTESALSFLGLGVQPPMPSWGNILTSGKDYLHVAWWLSVFPGGAILATVLALNLLGEGLRDVLDPRENP